MTQQVRCIEFLDFLLIEAQSISPDADHVVKILAQIFTNPNLMKYYGCESTVDISVIPAMINWWTEKDYNQKKGLHYLIFHKDGRFMGKCAVYKRDDNHQKKDENFTEEIELSIVLVEEFHHLGYSTDLRKLVSFVILGLRRRQWLGLSYNTIITICFNPDNPYINPTIRNKFSDLSDKHKKTFPERNIEWKSIVTKRRLDRDVKRLQYKFLLTPLVAEFSEVKAYFSYEKGNSPRYRTVEILVNTSPSTLSAKLDIISATEVPSKGGSRAASNKKRKTLITNNTIATSTVTAPQKRISTEAAIPYSSEPNKKKIKLEEEIQQNIIPPAQQNAEPTMMELVVISNKVNVESMVSKPYISTLDTIVSNRINSDMTKQFSEEDFTEGDLEDIFQFLDG